MLDAEQLRQVDEWALEELSRGRATPAAVRQYILTEYGKEYSSGYVQERLARLEEHDHAVDEYDVGLYELISDPRQEGS